MVTLGADINKVDGKSLSPESKEGVVGQVLPELTLEMENEKIVDLTKKWEKAWKESDKKQAWEKQCEENERYWKGKQYYGPKPEEERPMVDNMIFESVETYLPQATRRNPEPLTELISSEDYSQEANAYLKRVKERLAYIADERKLRLKLKTAARYWAMYLIGPVKYGWDMDHNMPTVRVVRPQKLILDPNATIDEEGYTGGYVGEYCKKEASTLLKIISEEDNYEESKKKIEEITKGNLGTEVQYVEFWTPQYICWRLDDVVLLKKKNIHWNWDTERVEEKVDEFGNVSPAVEPVEGFNHFAAPKMPYDFLSVFNLGTQPMDDTSLISQSLSNQDLINKRNRQITKNVDGMNGSLVVSLERTGLTDAQAKRVTVAARSGGAIAIPTGSPLDAVARLAAPALPSDVFNQLNDTRLRLRDIFGTRGSSPAGVGTESTVRGKILNRGLDTDRIGGGVSEYLEQLADGMYNWMLQLLYVYDPEFKPKNGQRPPRIKISVKEGSLLPKDSTTLANQAIDLANAGKMALIDLYKRLDYPNPEELAANVWLEANAPDLLYRNNPLVQEAIQRQQQQAQAESEAKAQAEMMKADAKMQADMKKEEYKAQLKTRSDMVDEATEPAAALSNVPTQNA